MSAPRPALHGFSVNGHDLYQVAIRVAGFCPRQLFVEIMRRHGVNNPAKINAATVSNAMQAVQHIPCTCTENEQEGAR